MKKILTALLILVSISLGTACWDQREVDERGIVLGLGLDQSVKKAEVPSGVEGALAEPGSKFYQVTFQLVAPGQVAGKEKGGGDKLPFWNLTVTNASSIAETFNEASTRSNRAPYLEHVQIVLIGQNLAKGGLKSAFDSILRESEIRKRVPVYITPGTAKEMLDIKPKLEGVNATYLTSLQNNADYTAHFAPTITLSQLSRNLHENSTYLIPRIIAGKGEAKLNGAGLFKGDKLIGWLGGMETQGVRLVTGKFEGGNIKVQTSNKGAGGVKGNDVLELTSASSRIIPIVHGKKVSFRIEITGEGTLVEHQDPSHVLNSAHLKDTEREFNRAIEKQIKLTVQKMQQQFQGDVFGFGRRLEERHPGVWKQLKKNWPQEFAQAEVQVQAQVHIRRVGVNK
ncbi:Ger(x)C family spore germination protein [Bacillota bacterium LX-D]|nr:Ger(x)C family spore germination protein [Bacillota bacterium LX-D]